MRQARWEKLRTALSGVDPGLMRLRLAAIATAAMMLAAGIMSGIRVLNGASITVVLFAAVLGMISNLAVNESDPKRRRVTTSLMILPAAVSVLAGTLLAPYRVLADVVFVAVTVTAVYVRRFGPRGFALGMAAFMSYFFTQFLHASITELGWLSVAIAVGIGSTVLLDCWVFAERPERTLRRLVRAFRAHLHALIQSVTTVLAAAGNTPDAVEKRLRDVRRRRIRLNETALLMADRLGQQDGTDAPPSEVATENENLALRILDAELAAERLAVTTSRLIHDGVPPNEESNRRALLAGLRCLGAASATSTPDASVGPLLESARLSVRPLVADAQGHTDRTQRVGLAVVRLADALESITSVDEPSPEPESGPERGADHRPTEDAGTQTEKTTETGGLQLTTRQAVQVGIATSLAIVVGEIISPSRWYWAVVAAFVVFAGTTSRGDVLSRGVARIIGTIGGVLAGMSLAAVVGEHHLVALVLMFCCVFLALYLVRVSQAQMAFWITAVLALLYGLIGQFNVQTLVLRIEETAVGAVLGILAGYLVLPTRTREAFGEALDDMVDAIDTVLRASIDRILGRATGTRPIELARNMDNALGTLRARARLLDNPLPRRRGRTSYQRALQVLTGVDHYARSLARVSDTVRISDMRPDPAWAATLESAADRVRANLDALRLLLHHEPKQVGSAEVAVDAAEAYAVNTQDLQRRADMLTTARLLRRIDQAVVGLATDLEPNRSEPNRSQ
jgi:hypothetical protein